MPPMRYYNYQLLISFHAVDCISCPPPPWVDYSSHHEWVSAHAQEIFVGLLEELLPYNNESKRFGEAQQTRYVTLLGAYLASFVILWSELSHGD